MPSAKRLRLLTVAPALSAAAVDEWKTGVEQFIAWANLARTGETIDPGAMQLDAALTAFSEGRNARFTDLALWAVTAGAMIRSHVRDSHWHLRTCHVCHRWLLAKDARQRKCRRVRCVRVYKTQIQKEERQLQRELDRVTKQPHTF